MIESKLTPVVIRTPRANLDLIEIWNYVAEASEERADKVIDEIGERCRMLAHYPEAGRTRHEVLINVRSFAVGKYVVFYQAIDTGIEVLRVLHGSRDVSTAFDEMIG